LVLVSGVGWDGAHNFVSGDGYGTSNARALATLRDPGGNFAFEVHQYLDDNYSGTHADCVDPAHAREALMPVTAWLRQQHARGFLGEFAASGDPRCLASLNAMLDVLDKNHDVWMGWSYWAGGPWWGNYMFSVQPRNGNDTPQMGVLQRHLGSGS
jgi:endoglucanase